MATAQEDLLLQSPRLGLWVRKMQEVLDRERARREEFYSSMSEQQKVEFINGEVVVQSPVRLAHDMVSGRLYKLLSTYVDRHGIGHVGHEKLLVSLTRNDYEPDVCFFGTSKAETFQPDQMRFPAPDYVAEVLSSSTESLDRGVKWEDYAAHGVEEYWLADPDRCFLEQYVLRGDQYELQLKSGSGEVRSTAVPGFVIPIASLFESEAHLRALEAILR